MNNHLQAAFIEEIVRYTLEEVNKEIEETIVKQVLEELEPKIREFAKTKCQDYILQSVEGWRDQELGKNAFHVTVGVVE